MASERDENRGRREARRRLLLVGNWQIRWKMEKEMAELDARHVGPVND